MTSSTEQMTLLRAVLDFVDQHSALLGRAQQLRLGGIAHYHMGNRSAAVTALTEAITLDADDLLSAYYLVQSLDGSLAETAETRRRVLQLAVAYTKSGEMAPEPLYYAGHIFFQNGMIEAAERCFGRCDDLLPALYMELAVMHHADPYADLGVHIGYLLQAEQKADQRGEPRYLGQAMPRIKPAGEPGWQDDLWHFLHVQELADVVQWVQGWLACYQRENGHPHPNHATLQPHGYAHPTTPDHKG